MWILGWIQCLESGSQVVQIFQKTCCLSIANSWKTELSSSRGKYRGSLLLRSKGSVLKISLQFINLEILQSSRELRKGRCNDQFSSVAQSCPTLCDPVDCSTPGLLIHHQLLEFTQTHVHWVGDAIQPSHLCYPFTTFNLSQHRGLFKWISSSHQVAKVLDFQLQHQSFQWVFRTDFL